MRVGRQTTPRCFDPARSRLDFLSRLERGLDVAGTCLCNVCTLSRNGSCSATLSSVSPGPEETDCPGLRARAIPRLVSIDATIPHATSLGSKLPSRSQTAEKRSRYPSKQQLYYSRTTVCCCWTPPSPILPSMPPAASSQKYVELTKSQLILSPLYPIPGSRRKEKKPNGSEILVLKKTN